MVVIKAIALEAMTLLEAATMILVGRTATTRVVALAMEEAVTLLWIMEAREIDIKISIIMIVMVYEVESLDERGNLRGDRVGQEEERWEEEEEVCDHEICMKRTQNPL